MKNAQPHHIVQRAYLRFEPKEIAFVHFPHAAAAHLAQSRIRTSPFAFLSGHQISAKVVTGSPMEELRQLGWFPVAAVGPNGDGQRTRGQEGKAQAAARGLVDGNGLGAGVSERAQNVVISGLPVGLEVYQLKRYFGEFKLAAEPKHSMLTTAK